MKTVALILLIITLTACAPSSQSIANAIEQTQAVQSTIASGISQTQTAIAPTATDTPPTPTDTPIPSATPTLRDTPKPTNTPQLSLDELVVTFDDIQAILPGFYSRTCSEINPKLNFGDVPNEAYACMFISSAAGIIVVELHKFNSEVLAKMVTYEVQKRNLEDGKSIEAPSALKLPENIWLVETNNQFLVLGFSQKEVVVTIFLSLPKGLTGDTASAFLSLVGQKQQEHLIKGGYK